jgi:hypothetical protein
MAKTHPPPSAGPRQPVPVSEDHTVTGGYKWTEYRVKWVECPTANHTSRVVFVKAIDKSGAKAIAKDHIERKRGVAWFKIEAVEETEPLPLGEVVGESKW